MRQKDESGNVRHHGVIMLGDEEILEQLNQALTWYMGYHAKINTQNMLASTSIRELSKPSQIRINMQLELLIRPIRRSVLELRAVQFKGQWSRCIDTLLAG